MALTVVDFLASQLRAAAPRADWGAAGVDRARELAVMLARAGVASLANLSIEPFADTQTVQTGSSGETGDGSPIYETRDIATYRMLDHSRNPPRIFGFLGTPDRSDNGQTLDIGESGYSLAWSAIGHGNVTYYVTQRPGGFAIVPLWASSSDLTELRDVAKMGALFAASFALPMAGVSLAGELGSAILGPALTAQYPALAGVVGNTALGTAFNGGNVAAAVRGAALSFAGAQGGGFVSAGVASASGLQILGDVSSSATSAVIRGQNLKSAIFSTLISNGVTSMPAFFDGGGIVVGENDKNWVLDDNGDAWVPGVWGPDMLPPVPIPDDSMIDSPVIVTTVYDPVFDAPSPLPIPDIAESAGSGWDQLAPLIKSALLLIPGVRQNAPVNTRPTVRTATGGTQTVTDQGVIVTRNAQGKIISTSRTPAKIPTLTASGALVVNNGNGTYDVVTSNGQRQTRPYNAGASTGGVNQNVLMYGALAVAAFFVLGKK